MKIGIVTQPLYNNYGGILQNWALQEKLRKMGHEPQTIDYLYGDTPFYILIASWLKTILMYCIGKPRPFAPNVSKLVRSKVFDKFVKNNINVTHCVHRYDSNLIKQYSFDIVIVGSDQVWRPLYNGNVLYDMYLRFVEQTKVKKIAYAVSFGTEEWEYSHKQTKVCARLAKCFNAISVREESGVKLCQKYLYIDAISVLDPTLLHTSFDYEKLCSDIPNTENAYLVSYTLDLNPEKQSFIEDIAKKHKLVPKIFSAAKDAELTVEEWLAMYRDAKYVVTDSFHGTVFAIIFHKPFLSIVNPKRGASRFYSLLVNLGLENYLLTSITQEIPTKKIEWNTVDEKLQILKTKSTEFLINALK